MGEIARRDLLRDWQTVEDLVHRDRMPTWLLYPMIWDEHIPADMYGFRDGQLLLHPDVVYALDTAYQIAQDSNTPFIEAFSIVMYLDDVARWSEEQWCGT